MPVPSWHGDGKIPAPENRLEAWLLAALDCKFAQQEALLRDLLKSPGLLPLGSSLGLASSVPVGVGDSRAPGSQGLDKTDKDDHDLHVEFVSSDVSPRPETPISDPSSDAKSRFFGRAANTLGAHVMKEKWAKVTPRGLPPPRSRQKRRSWVWPKQMAMAEFTLPSSGSRLTYTCPDWPSVESTASRCGSPPWEPWISVRRSVCGDPHALVSSSGVKNAIYGAYPFVRPAGAPKPPSASLCCRSSSTLADTQGGEETTSAGSGPKGTDFGNGESQYTAGPYEFLSVETRRLCERSCSERSWCAGYAFKHSKSQGRLPDWRLGACQLVGKRIVTATQVPQVASFGKAGLWQSHGPSKCQLLPKMLFKEEGHCTKGQVYSSHAWELSAPVGPKGFASPEYSSWLSLAWRRCQTRDRDTAFVSVWTDAGYRCYKSASCSVRADGRARSWSAVGPEKLSSLKEQNFNDRGQRTLNMRKTYTYKLSNGFTCTLRGWTHTRSYAKGFLRNKPGSGSAIVSGLQPGEQYVWQLYQYAGLFPGKNGVRVNGLDQGLAEQGKSEDPTLLGLAKADSKGQVVFAFTRSARHVHLSGLAFRRLNEARTERLSSLTQNSFHMRRRGNRNLDRNNGYVYKLSNGYNCELKGWTHSRDYARGVLRNVVGKATAVVSGLEPGALYSWKVYQFASQFGGSNGLSVNGEFMGLTVASRRTDATKTGAHRASAHGRITFEFQRRSAHVHLSGIALGKVYEAGDEYLSSVDDNNFDDRGNVNLNPAAEYVYKLSNGYPCKLRGWTHSRYYAKGFLRNQEGSATAVVSGLEPGKLYAWKIYQYAAAYGGRNKLRVNGGNFVWTTSSKSDAPTRTGLTKAKPSGEISFEFVRSAKHVHLSGLAIGRVREAESPDLQELTSNSLDACKRSCEKKAACQGVQYDSPKKRCSLWSSPFESVPAGDGVECLSWRRL